MRDVTTLAFSTRAQVPFFSPVNGWLIFSHEIILLLAHEISETPFTSPVPGFCACRLDACGLRIPPGVIVDEISYIHLHFFIRKL